MGQEQGCYCKPLEITVSICCFCWSLLVSKNQHHSSIQFWHILHLILRITFGRLRYAWLHPHNWTESNRCICARLTTCKKKKNLHTNSKFFLINFTPMFILTCCFKSLWACLTIPTWNDWKKLLLLLILYHMQKTNFITQLILKIKLTRYSSLLWACPAMPGHTHLR